MTAQITAGLLTRPVTAGLLTRPADFAACHLIYQEAFGLRPEDGSLNPRLLTGLSHNSGLVVGAHVGDELVGFAISFLARRDSDGRLYQYSQTAAVRPAWQGKGIGRAIKFAQRDAALAAGVDLLRWTYDPLRWANAHFNLDVLGAAVTDLARDMYGPLGAPAERGEPSDRFVADWELRAVPGSAGTTDPVAAAGLRPGELRVTGSAAMLGIPADWPAFRRHSPGAVAAMRERILGHADQLLAAGLAGVSCTRLDSDTAVYRFARRERP
jgi:predicted GNAT superfamily acetyltransferase